MSEYVHKGNDNTNDFILKADGASVDLSGVSKMVLDFGGGISVNSDDDSVVFDWSGGFGGLVLAMGGISELVAGKQYQPSLTVFDALNTNGVNWGKIDVVIL